MYRFFLLTDISYKILYYTHRIDIILLLFHYFYFITLNRYSIKIYIEDFFFFGNSYYDNLYLFINFILNFKPSNNFKKFINSQN